MPLADCIGTPQVEAMGPIKVPGKFIITLCCTALEGVMNSAQSTGQGSAGLI